MMTTAGSLALVGSRAPRDAFVVATAARRRRGDPRQDQPQRVGELPLHAFVERLERPRRPVPQPVRARPHAVGLEFGHRRRRGREPTAPRGSAPRPTARSSPRRAQLAGRHQADRRPGEPRRHHPDRHSQDTAGPDGAHGRRRRDPARRDRRRRSARRRHGRQRRHVERTTRASSTPAGSRARASASRARSARATAPRSTRWSRRRSPAMKGAGAVIVDPADIADRGKFDDSEFDVLLYEFKADLNAYLADLGPSSPARTLADLIAFNDEPPGRGTPVFRAGDLRAGAEEGAADRRRRTSRRWRRITGSSRTEGIDATVAKYRLDALVRRPAGRRWLIDLVNGDRGGGGSSTSTVAAVAGYPQHHGAVRLRVRPAGGALVLRPRLERAGAAALAYAYEQATRVRIAPRYLATAALD